MKLLQWLALACITCAPAFAVIEIGDEVPEMCWTASDDSQHCLSHNPNNVRVLLYNTGWCPPCNAEFKELSPAVKEFDGKAVTFISLSSQGWKKGSTPDKQFLNEWKDKHAIPFTVAASPKDAGKAFFEPPYYIPSVVIIDQKGKLVFKEVSSPVEHTLKQVRDLLEK